MHDCNILVASVVFCAQQGHNEGEKPDNEVIATATVITMAVS